MNIRKGAAAAIAVGLALLAGLNTGAVQTAAAGESADVAGIAVSAVSAEQIKTFHLEEERGVLRVSADMPVTGSAPVDAEVKRLIYEAIAAFKMRADGEGARRGSTAERFALRYEIAKLTADEIDIVFYTEVLHCGRTSSRRAAMTFRIADGAVLYATDCVLPDMTLPALKRVALTFDDGPTATTPYLLDELDKRGVKATFFVVGVNVERYPETVKRAYHAGHVIANHTYGHKNLNSLSAEKIRYQIRACNNTLTNIGIPAATMVRPPYGNANAAVRAAVDVPLINWSVDTRDWESKNAAKIERVIMRDVKDGAIILCHDTRWCTVEAVCNAIDKLREQGYEFVTVPELLFSEREPAAGKIYRMAA